MSKSVVSSQVFLNANGMSHIPQNNSKMGFLPFLKHSSSTFCVQTRPLLWSFAGNTVSSSSISLGDIQKLPILCVLPLFPFFFKFLFDVWR